MQHYFTKLRSYIDRIPNQARVVASILLLGICAATAVYWGRVSYVEYGIPFSGTTTDLSKLPPTPPPYTEEGILLGITPQDVAKATIDCSTNSFPYDTDQELQIVQTICSDLAKHPELLTHLWLVPTDNSQGIATYEGETYGALLAFHLRGSKEKLIFSIAGVELLPLSHTSQVQTVTVVNDSNSSRLDTTNTTVSIKSVEGDIKEYYYKVYFLRHSGLHFMPLQKDAQGRLVVRTFDHKYRNPEEKYSFEYYSSYGLGTGYYATNASHDYDAEVQTKRYPVYHLDGCGLEPSFPDSTFGLYDHQSHTNVTVNVHYATSSTLWYTTSKIGYYPNDWGKILGSYTDTTYKQLIQSKNTRHTHTVEMLTVGGLPVKHMKPFEPQRGCQAGVARYEQFQAVHSSGAVITFIFEDLYPMDDSNPGSFMYDEPLRSSFADRRLLVEKVLSTFTLR